MKPSSISISESLKNKLLSFPTLVDNLQNKDNSFLINLENWMKDIETIFKNNNISHVSEMAGFRSKILAPLFSESQNRSAKKRQIQVASECLYDIQRTVLAVLNPYELKVNEAKDIVLQLLVILSQSGSVKYINFDFQGFVNQIWAVFSTHEQLKPSTAKILTLVSQPDAVRIIAEEINLEDFK
jgi:hypothetical protein